MSQKAGVLGLPVCSTKKVQAIGVMPPKIAAARLNAKEKPTVRTRFGITSASVANHGAVIQTKEEGEVRKCNDQVGKTNVTDQPA